MALAIAVILTGAFGLYQWQRYQSAIERAERDMRSAIVLLAEHAARTMDAVEAALESAARIREDMAARRIPGDRGTLHNLLKAVHGASPMFFGVGLFDAAGNQLATSRFADAPLLNLADQEFFRVHRERAIRGLYISATYAAVRDGSPILNFSLRLENPDGSFAGVSAAALDPAYFAELYRRVDLGPSQVTGLFRADGAYLARNPHSAEWIGSSIGQGVMFKEHLSRVDSGIFHAVSPFDGLSRISGFSRVPGRPLVVTVSTSRADALGHFYRDLIFGGGFLALVLAVLAFGAHSLVGELRRREGLQLELAMANEAALDARDEAEAASGAKTEFLSRMSHELRTPLNAVIGFAQVLELNREGNLNASQKESLQYISRGGHHLLRLVNEVLDLAGIESGKLSLSIERVKLVDVLAHVRAIMQPLADQSRVTLRVDPPPQEDEVLADDLRLRQVLLNLTSNAVKYNRAGGSVSIAASPVEGGRVRIAVTDTGIGIPFERQAGLFVPFNRLGAEFTAVEGTGIGLALAKRFVEAMGGRIGFSSEPGSGSTFWVELPHLAAALAGDWRDAGPAALKQAPLAAAGGFTVLYVEDNPANLRLVEHILSTLPSVTMLAAPTPQLGLELAASRRPDIIVLDINLPGMSGYDVLARLKAMPETREIPVLALSAAALPSDIKRGTASGFFCYLTKPVDVRAFLAAIDAALGSAASRSHGA